MNKTVMSTKQVTTVLFEMEDNAKLKFLIKYGHELTIMARSAYAFKSEEVSNPKLLREINEISYRVFQAIKELEENIDEKLSFEGLSHWILCQEQKLDIQRVSMDTFNRTIQKCK